MSFDPEWLLLREPADHAARNKRVLQKVSTGLSQLDEVSFIDLAAGAGSNLRGICQYFGPRQFWTLVDHDLQLLKIAKQKLCDWADRRELRDNGLCLWKGDKRLEIDFLQADLAGDLSVVLDRRIDLVTTAAFLDLVSAEWLSGLASALTARSLPLYACLNYSGVEHWSPAHLLDQEILRAFNFHQKTDKGFGVALGLDAAGAIGRKLEEHGYRLATGDSPWLIDRANNKLMRSLAAGIAAAVTETNLVQTVDIESWQQFRHSSASCVIQHTDIFAFRPTSEALLES